MSLAEPTVVAGGEVGETPTTRRSRPGWALVRHALSTPAGFAGFVITAAVSALALLGPFVAPYGSTDLLATAFETPSADHWLGTDQIGRDVFSRVLDGGWMILLLAAGATAIGVGIGGVLAVTAAYRGGWFDAVVMRGLDLMFAFPSLVLTLLLVSMVSGSATIVMVAVGVTHIPICARVLRAAALDVSEREFVQAAELQGVSPLRIVITEIVPNLTGVFMVEIGLRLTWSVGGIAALNFIGFGQSPPTPSWGNMIQEAQVGLLLNPWACMAPVLLLALLSIGTYSLTDAIAQSSKSGGVSQEGS
ncbi:MAG: ABC transporter permease [Actinomycetota bacterium]|nr:ABC transporter permease [Actinomycetota bacterium]